MSRARLLPSLASALFFLISATAAFAANPRPNIVFVMADDLGYGDVRSFNPESKIATPNLDRLAAEGMRFTDAHTSSSVCTPTRYGLLTGRYNWRSRLKNGVQGGMSPRLIEPGRLTLPALLKEHGYATACIGKWHLGMDWALKPGAEPFDDRIEKGEEGWRADFSQPITNGPNSLGFDYFFGIAASLDMVPYTFVENDRVTVQPDTDKAFPMIAGRTGGTTRRGPAAAEFEDVDVMPEFTRKAVEFIAQRADAAKAGAPFFLYLPLAAPHTPIAPAPEWVEKSGLNPYGDFVMQTDACAGAVMDALERHGLSENTLFIFTSDNGCSPEAKFAELLEKGHRPSAHLRGAKADIYEGGHRVPFIARWPGKIKAGATSEQLICLNDMMATCAEQLGAKLPPNAAEDSVSFLSALTGGAPAAPMREALVHHSINGSFAIRKGQWKLALCPDSGGWSAPRPNTPAAKGLPPVQLYDLAADPGEQRNVQAEHPELVRNLTALLEQYAANGRSTPGPPQPNTGEVRILKTAAAASPQAPSPAKDAPPNVILIISDDHGWTDYGFMGHPPVRTPHLDRLAGQSLLFPRGYVPASLCCPSLASIITGRYPHEHRITSNDPPKPAGIKPGEFRKAPEFLAGRARMAQFMQEAATLPRLLAPRGYVSFQTGKWWQGHFSTGGFTHGMSHGNESEGGRHGDAGLAIGRRTLQPVFDFIAEAQREAKPFFVWYAPFLPHDPHNAPARFQKYRDKAPDEPTARYWANVEWFDETCGELLKHIDDRQLAENTIVLYVADNGWIPGAAVNRFAPRSKQSPYDGGLRTPIMVRWLGKVAAHRSDALASSIDLAPTILAAAGIPSAEKLPGLNLLDHAAISSRTSLFGACFTHDAVELDRPASSLRWRWMIEGEWKLIAPAPQNEPDGAIELFHITADPFEKKNVAAAEPERVERLRTLLDSWWKGE